MFPLAMERDGERLRLRTVTNVFTDFIRRRAGIIKALTTDYEEFRAKCDPEAEHLCLYGLPNEEWEVKEPDDTLPAAIPEPVLGINFARDEMPEKDWLAVLAVHCDTWLLAVAYFLGANFDKAKRKQLFNLINDLPSVFEVVSGESPRRTEDLPIESKNGGSTSESNSRVIQQGSSSHGTLDEKKKEDAPCGACEEYDMQEDRFWICCDECSVWYHGTCVKITPAEARRIRYYKCPPCCKKIKLWHEFGSYFIG